MKAIVVTGGTQVDWDNVRTVTNRATGVQGMWIASSLQKRGVDVTVVAAESVVWYNKYGLDTWKDKKGFRTYDELVEVLDKAIAEIKPDFLFMPAAISDAAPVKVEGKLKIEFGEYGTFMVPFRKLPKILPTLREKCGPETIIVGFKLLSDGSSPEDLMWAAHEQLTTCGTNLCVGNIVNFDTGGKQKSVTLFQLQECGGADPGAMGFEFEGSKKKIAEQLCDHIIFMHPKSTLQSSVVGVLHADAPRTQVLLLRRSTRDPIPGWCLPGGKVEKGEHPHDALVREFKEETGLDVEIVGGRIAQAVKYLDGRLYEIDAYEVRKVGGELLTFPTDEHMDSSWVHPQAAPRGTGSATLSILEEVNRRDEEARLWVHALYETTKWHEGTEDISEAYGGEFSERIDITADRMSGEIVSVFINPDGTLFTDWVYAGHGGIDTPETLKGVADTLVSEITSNDDGFGFSPEYIHPVLRDLMWPEMANYWRM